jgi:iron complex outermembrane recepter protein
MNTFSATLRSRLTLAACLRALLFRRCFLLTAALMTASAPLVRAAEAGVIVGTVSNMATGNLLEGAKVSLPQLGLSVLTDNTGRYALTNVPPGTHEIAVSYIGLDPMRTQVTVSAGRPASQNFDLTTGIYKLDAFKVTGEREGGAAAITAQRNAENVKNIVAMDSFGNLPNMNAAEVAIRLPGVVGNLSNENLVDGFTIRGIGAGLNSLTMDGSPLTTEGPFARNTNINNLTGTMFEQLELIKGQTPDKGADSLGATINLKTRSPLSMREKRRISYNLGVRSAPSFTEQVPLREAHRHHPIFNVTWQEVFGVFGGDRNLGISLNLFYSENAVGGFRTIRDYQDTLNSPAFLWDYRTWDNYNNRKQGSVNLKTDYRLSSATKLSLNAVISDATETFRRQYETRAFTGNQSTVPSGTSGVIPGYSDRVTRVRAVPASTINQTTTGPGNFYNRMRRFDLGAEHKWGPFEVDYNAIYTQTNINGGGGGRGGILINQITNVGWVIDRTESDLYPKFIQTEGPDFTDYHNYRPTTYTNNNQGTKDMIRNGRLNLKYQLPTTAPISFKTGADWRRRYVANYQHQRQWSYIGSGPIPADPSIVTFESTKTGRITPIWENVQIFPNKEPANPALWRENLYQHEVVEYTGNRAVTETITSGYVMAQGKFGHEGFLGRTGFITGVRREKTETDSWGWVRARRPSTMPEQLADPVGSARRDYADTERKLHGDYTKSFPSAHLTHDLTPNLKTRLAWSTSFGRPSLNNALPNETINENLQTLTVSNPSLLPQMATNWDATLEYYFEPVGSLSVGWFHKKITDYIVTGMNSGTISTGPDNGFGGEYAGWTRLTSANAGTAYAQGWEFSYQQQFTFLPGLLKGLGFTANYTIIDTHGNFGGTAYREGRDVPGFIPRTGNAILQWHYRKFGARVLYNYVGEYITNFSAVSAARSIYRYALPTVNAGVSYQLRPSLNFTVDVGNLFNEPQRWYIGTSDRLQQHIMNGTTITVGVNGRF